MLNYQPAFRGGVFCGTWIAQKKYTQLIHDSTNFINLSWNIQHVAYSKQDLFSWIQSGSTICLVANELGSHHYSALLNIERTWIESAVFIEDRNESILIKSLINTLWGQLPLRTRVISKI